MALFKSDPVMVEREEWDALRKDVQELKEIVTGMASAMQAMADASAALSSSPMGKMLGNLFPGE